MRNAFPQKGRAENMRNTVCSAWGMFYSSTRETYWAETNPSVSLKRIFFHSAVLPSEINTNFSPGRPLPMISPSEDGSFRMFRELPSFTPTTWQYTSLGAWEEGSGSEGTEEEGALLSGADPPEQEYTPEKRQKHKARLRAAAETARRDFS